MKAVFFISLGLLFSVTAAHATHIKGGKITFEHLTGLTYKIILTGYTDESPTMPFGSSASIEFGDGQSEPIYADGSEEGTPIGGGTMKYELEFYHTYTSGGNYLVRYFEVNRNSGVLNMENSGVMPFYIEANIIVDNLYQNSGVRILKDPVHIAYLNQTYHYNPQATDPDGDSISYHLVPPKQGEGVPVAGFTYPNETFSGEGGSEAGGNAYFTIDPVSGDLVWDAPVRAGEYNVAIEFKEWRKTEGGNFQVGSSVLDYQIIVRAAPVEDPELIFPAARGEILMEAENPWETTITAVAANPEDTVVLRLAGSFLLQHPEITPSDSIGGKGSVTVSLSFVSPSTAIRRFHLIASAYIYSSENGTGPSRNKAVYLRSSGYINGFSDLQERTVPVFPNPVADGYFYIGTPLMDGRKVNIKIFAADGRLVYEENVSSFTHQIPVRPQPALSGVYLLQIREGIHFYTSRILFKR